MSGTFKFTVNAALAGIVGAICYGVHFFFGQTAMWWLLAVWALYLLWSICDHLEDIAANTYSTICSLGNLSEKQEALLKAQGDLRRTVEQFEWRLSSGGEDILKELNKVNVALAPIKVIATRLSIRSSLTRKSAVEESEKKPAEGRKPA
jgi:hypothetical protein